MGLGVVVKGGTTQWKLITVAAPVGWGKEGGMSAASFGMADMGRLRDADGKAGETGAEKIVLLQMHAARFGRAGIGVRGGGCWGVWPRY